MTDVARLEPVDRGNIDDCTATAGQHGEDLVLHAQPDALQVAAHDFVPLRLSDVRDGRIARTGDAGIVDCIVQATEFLDGGAHHAFHVRAATHIGWHEQSFTAQLNDSLHDAGALVCSPSGD